MNDEVTLVELQEAFFDQARALADAGADGLVIETMSDLEEARIAVTAAKSTGLPVVGCVVFDSGKSHDRTMMGNTPEGCAKALTDAGADVMGSNCGQGIAGFIAICRRLHAATNLPIWIKANAGLPRMVDGRAVYDTMPDDFASFIPTLTDAGASFIGGCCGTDPSFIRAADRTVRLRKIRSPLQPPV
jgi:methionine synthase I (cobalamin-dependent)